MQQLHVFGFSTQTQVHWSTKHISLWYKVYTQGNPVLCWFSILFWLYKAQKNPHDTRDKEPWKERRYVHGLIMARVLFLRGVSCLIFYIYFIYFLRPQIHENINSCYVTFLSPFQNTVCLKKFSFNVSFFVRDAVSRLLRTCLPLACVSYLETDLGDLILYIR